MTRGKIISPLFSSLSINRRRYYDDVIANLNAGKREHHHAGRWKIDVGRSAIGKTKTSVDNRDRRRVYTSAIGGEYYIFAMGDINVNEARVMTFMGGDIIMWSDEGDVKAGVGFTIPQ
jgi:hypothetical protein